MTAESKGETIYNYDNSKRVCIGKTFQHNKNPVVKNTSLNKSPVVIQAKGKLIANSNN